MHLQHFFPCCSLVTPSETSGNLQRLSPELWPSKTKRAASLLTARFCLTWQRGFSFSILPKMMILTFILWGWGSNQQGLFKWTWPWERDTYIYIYIIYIYLHIHARIYVQLQQENARKPPRWGILSSCTEPGDRLPGSSNAINHCGMGKTHLQLTSTDSEFSNVIFVKF